MPPDIAVNFACDLPLLVAVIGFSIEATASLLKFSPTVATVGKRHDNLL